MGLHERDARAYTSSLLLQKLVPQNCVVRTGGHEKYHGYGQEEICPRRQECLPGEDGGVRWWRSGKGPADNHFVIAPDNSPDVEQHDETHAAADADGEHVVVVLAHGRVVHKKPSRGNDQNGG